MKFWIRPGVIVALVAVAPVHNGGPQMDPATKVRLADAYGSLPLGFEANRGQADSDVQFVSRGAGYTLFLMSTEAVLALHKGPHDARRGTALLRMKLAGGNPVARVSQDEELPGKSNYIIGNDRRNWHTQVPRYGRVKYHDVYPGVDLVYYGNQRQLEYDFVVAPGADPDVIALGFEGAQEVHVDGDGNLVLDTGDGDVRLQRPVIYQEIDGRRHAVSGGYKKIASNRVAFQVGPYDAGRPLVVDPILAYSTYLGGANEDFALGIAVDGYGGTYVTGYTTSIDFPVSGALQPACATNGSNGYPDCVDVFITKLSPFGSSVQYSTYFGGTSTDVGSGIAVDAATQAYVTGWTDSRDFPTVNAVEPTFGENPSATTRAFVAKLSSDGASLVYSTYLGADEPSIVANAIAVDSEGAPYVTGAAGPPYSRMGNAFVTKLTPDGSTIAYSVRLGGPAVGYGIAVDAQGYASVTGETESSDFPRVNAPGPASGRGFAAKVVPDGSSLVYSTYLWGERIGTGIAVAGPGTYLTGVMPGVRNTTSVPPPVGLGGGSTDAFVDVLDFGGRPLNGTYFGGTGDDRGSAIGVDRFGNVWVAGVTTSTDFPLVNPLQGRVRDLDAFVVRFNPGLAPVFSTYLGGSGREQVDPRLGSLPGPPGPALAVDSYYSAASVAGFTDSTDFPIANAVQPTGTGSVTGFLAMLYDDGIPTKPDLAVTEIGGTPAEAELGVTLGYLLQVTNKGPARATSVTFLDQLPQGMVIDRVLLSAPPSFLRSCDHDARLVFCRLDTLSEGESVIIAITATPTTVGTQVNRATVGLTESFIALHFAELSQGLMPAGADEGRDGNFSDNSVTTTTTITQQSVDLSVTGSASPDVVMLDGTVTYTLDVENHGSVGVAATLTDTLPAGATVISATQAGSFGSCSGTSAITCQWPSLSGVARVTIVARATGPGPLSNTAVVSSVAPDPNGTNNTATFVTRVNRPPTANAGPDQVVNAGSNCQAMVTLNGTGSGDPDGDTLTYTWTSEDLLPPPIVLSNGSVAGSSPTGPLPLGIHTITLTVSDGYGGTASDTVVVTVRDATPPAFSGVPAPAVVEQSSQSGATATLALPTAADNCSGSVVVSSNAPAVFPPGSTTVTFTARDAAGNGATAATTVTVVDTTPPGLAITSPRAQTYIHSDVVVVGFSATDAASGLAAGMPIAALDGARVSNGQSVSLLTLSLGTHRFVVSATDVAGTSRNQEVTFRVIATLDSLIASVNVFVGQNKIDDSNTAKGLLGKLNDAMQAVQRGKNAAAISKLQDFIDQVNAQRGRHISADAAQLLVVDAQYVISALR